MNTAIKEEHIALMQQMYDCGKSYTEIALEIYARFGIPVHSDSVRYYVRRKKQKKLTKLEKLQNENIEKVLVISDLHIPFQRDDILKIVTEYADEVSLIILNGDVLDCKSISSFVELGRGKLIDEMGKAHTLLKMIDALTPNTPKIITQGNHEVRLKKYLAKNPNELNNMHTDNIMKEIIEGFKSVDHETGTVKHYKPLDRYQALDTWFFNYKGMICCHPLSFSKVPAKTAYNAVEYFVRNGYIFDTCLVAHTHHYGSCINLGKYTVETGCLCKEQPYAATGKLNYTPQDYGYHLAVFKDGVYDINLSKNYILK